VRYWRDWFPGAPICMKRLLPALRSGVLEFGPLLLFWVLLWTVDLKIAIGVGVGCMLLDAAYRWWRGLPISKLYMLSAGLTVVFGCIDLWAQTPFMLKYEDVITSIVIAVAFAWGARGEKSMMQGLVEQQQGDAFEDGPDIRRFFKLFTLLWAGYFLLKAGVYAWLGEILPIDEALTIRPIVGMVSLGGMMLLSFKAQMLFDLAVKVGLLPKPAE
jgi:intracellular septation protein A